MLDGRSSSASSPPVASPSSVVNTGTSNLSFNPAAARFHLHDVGALQHLLGSLLKAVTSLSEEAKSLRHDMNAVSQITAQCQQDMTNLRTKVAGECVTRDDLAIAVHDVRQQLEKESLGLHSHKTETHRDRDSLIHRIAALEVDLVDTQKTVRESVAQAKVAAASQDGRFGTSAQQALDELTAQHRQLDLRVHQLERTAERTVEDVHNTTEQLQQQTLRIDEAIRGVNNLGQRVEAENHTQQKQWQQALSDLAKTESQQKVLFDSIQRNVDERLESATRELDASVDTIEGRMQSKLQQQSVLFEARFDSVKEQLLLFGGDVADTKSEVSMFNVAMQRAVSVSEKSASTALDRCLETERRLDQTIATMQSHHQHSKQQKEAAANMVSQAMMQSLDISQKEVYSQVKDMMQDLKLQLEHVEIPKAIQRCLEEEFQPRLENHELLASTVDSLVSLTGSMKQQVTALYQVLWLDPQGIPADVAGRRKVIPSLPWYPTLSGAATAAAAAPPSSSSFFSGGAAADSHYGHAPQYSTQPHRSPPRGNASGASSGFQSYVTPQLGLEVRPVRSSGVSGESAGVEVTHVVPGGVAERSGVSTGDIIAAVNDTRIDSLAHFVEVMAAEEEARLVRHQRGETVQRPPKLWLRKPATSSGHY